MRTVAFVALMGCLLSWTAVANAQDRIPWVADWREARDIAQQQHRLVLLHFYSDGCAPCKKLERDVFPRAEVARAISTGYVAVKINVDRFPQLRDHYKVTSWPTDVIVSPAGKEVARSNSPLDANRYVAMLDTARAQYGVGSHLTEQVAGQTPATQQASGLPPSRYGTGGFGGNAATSSTATNSGYGNPGNASVQPQTSAPPQQPSYVTNQFAGGDFTPNVPAQPAGVAPRYGDAYPGPSAGQQAGGPQSSVTPPYGQPSQVAPQPGTSQSNPYAQQAANPYAGQPSNGPGNGYGNPGNGYGNPANDNRVANNANAFQGYQPPTQQNVYAPQQPAPSQPAPPQQQAPPQQSVGPQPPTSSEFAMDGFCPVTLVDQGKWQKGDTRWGAVHQSKTYLFTSPQAQQQFLASPDRFAPILSGFDPVRYAETGQLVDGKREHGVFFQNRIFLFADEVALDRFSKQTDFYMDRVRQASAVSPQQPGLR